MDLIKQAFTVMVLPVQYLRISRDVKSLVDIEHLTQICHWGCNEDSFFSHFPRLYDLAWWFLFSAKFSKVWCVMDQPEKVLNNFGILQLFSFLILRKIHQFSRKRKLSRCNFITIFWNTKKKKKSYTIPCSI